MDGSIRRRRLAGMLVALGLALVVPAVPATPALAATHDRDVATTRSDAALAPWDGSVNLYRRGVFTTQKTWLWCTAAGVQIIRNMVERDDDHSRRNQERYFDWMRGRNRYDLPRSAGVDPQGWTAGLRRFVDDRYRLIASRTFESALRLAVIRIRKTGLPVALTVSHGGHGWILHGFTATADPARSSDFRVTSVRVTGPLWGRQDSSFGYDMRPNTKLTPRQLKRFFTPWKYAPKAMIWDGRFVSIQPVTPRRSSATSAATAAGAAGAAPATAGPSAGAGASAGAGTNPTPVPLDSPPAVLADVLPWIADPAPSVTAPGPPTIAPPPPTLAPLAVAAPVPATTEPPSSEPASRLTLSLDPERAQAMTFLLIGMVVTLAWYVFVRRRDVTRPSQGTVKDIAPPRG